MGVYRWVCLFVQAVIIYSMNEWQPFESSLKIDFAGVSM